MTRETVMSTPIFDQLLREMAQRAEPHATPPPSPSPDPPTPQDPDPQRTPTRGRRHRAD